MNQATRTYVSSVVATTVIFFVGVAVPCALAFGNGVGIGLGAMCAVWGGPGFGVMVAGARRELQHERGVASSRPEHVASTASGQSRRPRLAVSPALG